MNDMQIWPYTPEVKKQLDDMNYWRPLLGPQALFVHLVSSNRQYRECLYGGARGGGKTDASIAICADRIMNDHYRALVLRRNAGDLDDYASRCEEKYQCFNVQVRRNPMVLRFGENSQRTKGAVIKGGHLHDKNSYIQYQGQEFSRIFIEELTQIPSETLYKQVMSSCRSKYRELFPQMILTANPGGVGMGWVKKRFVEPIDLRDEDYTTTELPNDEVLLESARVKWWKRKYNWEDEKGVQRVTVWNEIYDKKENENSKPGEEVYRIFVPSTIDDNPELLDNDPAYVSMLEGLKTTDKALYEAWRHGDWSVFAGQVFTEFSRDKHVINNFADIGPITTEEFDAAVKIISMDWGYSDNTAIYFTTLLQGRPVTYYEMHGNKKLASEWGEELYEYLSNSEQRIDYFVYPDDMEDKKNGFNSPIDDIQEWINKLPPDRQPIMQKMGREGGSRMIRQQVTHKFLQMKPECCKIFKCCQNLIRCLPNLVYDEDKPEEIDTRTDHELTNPYDGWSYGLRWLAERKAGELIHKSEYVIKKQEGVILGKTTYKEMGIDPADILRKQKHDRGDWKTR
ncbi:MAG: phage terminase large subunit [Clostridiales bacterium]|nr:phage terminase large subunit [Clostridiales bacterium]